MTRIGAQRPRLSSLPADVANTDAGDEVIEFAERFGLFLDDWQQWTVRNACAERADGSLAATQAVLLVPRQSGKSAVLEALEMAALFLWDYEHVIYSAHLQKTATDHMRRIRRHIDRNPDLKRIARVLTGKGDERVERVDTGAILEFITRGKKSSRGGSPGMVIFDEALFLQDAEIEAMLPALSAQSMNEDASAQMIYTSSAPIAESAVLHRLRNRGLNDRPRRMFFAEWSAEPDCDPADRDNWYLANPGLGIRISEEWIEDNEFGTMSEQGFATERLGVPVPPPTDDTLRPIPDDIWDAALRPGSAIESERHWALAVTPLSSAATWAAIGVAGRRADGVIHVEFLEHKPGTEWVEDLIIRGWESRRIPIRIYQDGAEKSFISRLRARGVEVVEVSTSELAEATGAFVDGVRNGQVVHIGQPDLSRSVAGAVLKTAEAGASVWSQRQSTVEITPLQAVTVAAGGVPEPAAVDLLTQVF